MPGGQPERIQRSQAEQLKEWHRYLLGTYASDCDNGLEVGCGFGYVMSNLEDLIPVEGIDIDTNQIAAARKVGHMVREMDGSSMDLEDGSFDLVYCSFYLMWTGQIRASLEEMSRVARRKVIVFSEPYWSGSIRSPPEMGELVEAWKRLIRRRGGDPDSGLRTVESLRKMDMPCRFGTVPKDQSGIEIERIVALEEEVLIEEGINPEVPYPLYFDVPFIWGVIFKE